MFLALLARPRRSEARIEGLPREPSLGFITHRPLDPPSPAAPSNAPILSSDRKMSQNYNQVQEEHVQEARNYFDGYSPELIAACIQDCSPGVAAALMATWEPSFAAAVQQHIDVDGWAHIVDGSQDPELSVTWLRSVTDISLAKQVVDKVRQLDKSRGHGMARAVQLMKALRSVRTLPTTALANVANSTNSKLPIETRAPSSNQAISRPQLPPGSLASPAGVLNSSSSPNDAHIPLLTATTASTVHNTAALRPPALPSIRHAAHSPALSADVSALDPSAEPIASLPPTADPLAPERGQRPSSPPQLPPRGPLQRKAGSGPERVIPVDGSLFAGTPLPQVLGVGVPADARPPGVATASSRASPQGSPTPGVVAPGSPPTQKPPTEALHSPVAQPRLPTQLAAKRAVEVVVNSLDAEQKTKYARTPAPRQPRSPSPMEEDEEESGVESGDDYVPEDSSQEAAQAELEHNTEQEDAPGSGNEESNTETDEESDSNSDEGTDEAETGSSKKRKRHPKIKQVEIPTAWTWEKAKNDRLVSEWDLEKAIDKNPAAVHPVRTEWMYQARLKDLTEEDYEDKLRSEHKELMKVPPACRSVVGQMFYKRSNGDWELRVVLTCLTWRYTKLKIKKGEATAEGDKAAARARTTEMMKLLNEGIDELFERFPDMDPEHERRQIERKLGADAVSAYVQTLRTKVSSDAGRMFSACRASGGTLAMLESKSADRKTLSIMDIFGKKRKDIAFHLWGGSSSGGRDECNKVINERMQKWKRLNLPKTSREISNESLKVVCDVRKERFEDLPPKVQAAWEEKAKHLYLPQTDEERQCLVDAILPSLFRLLAQLSTHTSLHFILLASGQGTSNVPVLVHEFSESTEEQLSFSEDNPTLWQRMRSDYLKYAVELHNTGQEEIVEGLPVMHTPDDSHTEHSTDPRPTQSKKREKGRSPISPFQPNPSAVKSRSQRIAYLSKWFMDAGERIVGYKLTWDTFCKNVRKYVLTERMPMDPLVEGKRLEIQKPAAMEDPRFDAWWKFMVASYDGSLPEDDRFMFQVEALHMNIPAPPIPAEASTHQAAINSAKTVPMKKSAAKGGAKKGRKLAKRFAATEDDGLLDAAGLAEDLDAAMLHMALDDQPKPKGKQRARNTLRVESPDLGTSPPGEEVPASSRPRENLPPRKTAPAPAHPGGRTTGVASKRELPDTHNAGQNWDSEVSLNVLEEDASTPTAQEVESSGVSPKDSKAESRPKPRPRGILVAATDTLRHPSFPGEDKDLASRWQEELVKLTGWGRRMGVGPTSGKVLRFRGFVKKGWASLLPTGLDAVFCILQIWSACQDGDSPLPPISIAPRAGLTSVDPNHPIALAINLLLDPQKTLPTVKVLNVQFGASPEANDAFFDFMEGSLTALVRRALQSEDVFLDGLIDVVQILRLATFVGGTGFIRDLSTVSEHTTRTSALVDQLNIFLASLSLVRYYHVVLGRVASAFCSDESIDGAEKDMWALLKDTWTIAIRSMARAVVERRSDLFDRKTLPSLLPDTVDRMVQTSLGLRPWWKHGELGLPSAVGFTTKQSLASSCLYDTLALLDWSSFSLLERSQYLLLVFLACIQVHNGRVPSEPTTLSAPQRRASASSPKTIEKMTKYLHSLKDVLAASTETGDVDPPLEDRLLLPNVRRAIKRWESESRNPGVIQVSPDDDEVMESVAKANEVAPLPSLSPIAHQSGNEALENEEVLTGSGAIPSGSDPGGLETKPEARQNELRHPTTSLPLPADEPSTASSGSNFPFEEEDQIWPDGDGPAPVCKAHAQPLEPNASPSGGASLAAPEIPESVVPAVRPRAQSPTPVGKAKRRRIVPETPLNWRADDKESDQRQLRSNRRPQPQAAATAAGSTGKNRRRTKLQVIDETQARVDATSSRRQSSRTKRPPA